MPVNPLQPLPVKVNVRRGIPELPMTDEGRAAALARQIEFKPAYDRIRMEPLYIAEAVAKKLAKAPPASDADGALDDSYIMRPTTRWDEVPEPKMEPVATDEMRTIDHDEVRRQALEQREERYRNALMEATPTEAAQLERFQAGQDDQALMDLGALGQVHGVGTGVVTAAREAAARSAVPESMVQEAAEGVRPDVREWLLARHDREMANAVASMPTPELGPEGNARYMELMEKAELDELEAKRLAGQVTRSSVGTALRPQAGGQTMVPAEGTGDTLIPLSTSDDTMPRTGTAPIARTITELTAPGHEPWVTYTEQARSLDDVIAGRRYEADRINAIDRFEFTSDRGQFQADMEAAKFNKWTYQNDMGPANKHFALSRRPQDINYYGAILQARTDLEMTGDAEAYIKAIEDADARRVSAAPTPPSPPTAPARMESTQPTAPRTTPAVVADDTTPMATRTGTAPTQMEVTAAGTQPHPSPSARVPDADAAQFERWNQTLREGTDAAVKHMDVASAAALKRFQEGVPAALAQYGDTFRTGAVAAARGAPSIARAALEGAIGTEALAFDIPVALGMEINRINQPLAPIEAMFRLLGEPVKVEHLSGVTGAGGYDLLARNMYDARDLYNRGVLTDELWTTLKGDPRVQEIWAEQKAAKDEQARREFERALNPPRYGGLS